MKHAWSIGVALIAVGFAAAGEESPHEQAIVKMLGSLDKISAALQKIVDEDSALAAKPELRKEAALFIEMCAKIEKLQPPEKAEKVRLEKLYKPKTEESLKKLNTEKTRVELIQPGGKDALREIAGIFKKNAK